MSNVCTALSGGSSSVRIRPLQPARTRGLLCGLSFAAVLASKAASVDRNSRSWLCARNTEGHATSLACPGDSGLRFKRHTFHFLWCLSRLFRV